MTISHIAVIGAGTMGHGIAHAAAVGGFDTAVQDIAGEALERAKLAIDATLAKGVAAGKLSETDRRAATARLRYVEDLDQAARDADLVIEAAPEQIELKLDLFSRLDRCCRLETVIASNTSALSITEMAAATKRPAQVAGMHFFNPVHKMRLVEIVRALETAPSTIETIREVARRMGKEPVVVRESPGFVTSRVNAMIGNEAFYMLEEGVASAEDIDTALKLGLNHPMGPFELGDLVGLDVRLSVLEFLQRTLGEKFRPCPLLVQYVKAGRLGRKVGRGVYDYSKPATPA